MTSPNNKPNSLADVLAIVAAADLAPARRRDMISSINRLCEMAGRSLSAAPAEASAIRAELRKIRPARFGVSAKTFSNQRSLLAAALRQADALDDTECQSASNFDPVSASNIDPFGKRRRDSARPGVAGRGCGAGARAAA